MLGSLFGNRPHPQGALPVKKMVSRPPRVPLEALHGITFRDDEGEDRRIANISASGLAFIKDGRAFPPLGHSMWASLGIQGKAYPVNVRLVHEQGDLVGGAFENSPIAVAKAIGDYLNYEISALEMVAVPPTSLQRDEDGEPHWFYGENGCELFCVTQGDQVLRFQLGFFGHFLESAAGGALRFGEIVEEQLGAKPAYKRSSLIHWVASWDEERFSAARRIVKSIPKLKPVFAHQILEALAARR